MHKGAPHEAQRQRDLPRYLGTWRATEPVVLTSRGTWVPRYLVGTLSENSPRIVLPTWVTAAVRIGRDRGASATVPSSGGPAPRLSACLLRGLVGASVSLDSNSLTRPQQAVARVPWLFLLVQLRLQLASRLSITSLNCLLLSALALLPATYPPAFSLLVLACRKSVPDTVSCTPHIIITTPQPDMATSAAAQEGAGAPPSQRGSWATFLKVRAPIAWLVRRMNKKLIASP